MSGQNGSENLAHSLSSTFEINVVLASQEVIFLRTDTLYDVSSSMPSIISFVTETAAFATDYKNSSQ